MCAGCTREAEAVCPAMMPGAEVRDDIPSVKEVARATCVNDLIRRYRERGHMLYAPALVIPMHASLAEGDSTDLASLHLKMKEHASRRQCHLLAKALGDDRYIDELQKLVGVATQATAVE